MNNLRNSVRLVGFIGKDPEVKTFDNGKKKVRLIVATQESFRNAQGEKQTHTQWHNVVAWGRQANIAEQYLTKGKQIAVAGRLIYKNYEDSTGKRQYITEILMNELVMLSNKTTKAAAAAS